MSLGAAIGLTWVVVTVAKKKRADWKARKAIRERQMPQKTEIELSSSEPRRKRHVFGVRKSAALRSSTASEKPTTYASSS